MTASDLVFERQQISAPVGISMARIYELRDIIDQYEAGVLRPARFYSVFCDMIVEGHAVKAANSDQISDVEKFFKLALPGATMTAIQHDSITSVQVKYDTLEKGQKTPFQRTTKWIKSDSFARSWMIATLHAIEARVALNSNMPPKYADY